LINQAAYRVSPSSAQLQYHGTEPRATVDSHILVVCTGRRHFAFSHPRVIVAVDDAFECRPVIDFPKSVLPVVPKMLLHRRATVYAATMLHVA